jgi:uncharacterized protein (DUF736 family)
MACIGTFSFYDGKYSGSISTLTVNAKATIVQNDTTGDNTPTHLVMVGGAQVGAGWTKTAQESGAKYLSIKLDDPSFPAPVFARLVERGDLHELYWTREPVRAERAA